MHPEYVSDKPGSCPICGMDLVKKEMASTKSSPEASLSTFRISSEKQQLIGVRKGTVEKRHLVREVRAVARVVIDRELYDAQKEYLGSDIINTQYWNPAKQKLFMLGMSEEEIEALRKRRWPDNGLLAYVPSGSKGFYRTAYPETVWVYALVFEDEMHWIKPGHTVKLTSNAFPGETFSGIVMGIAQTVDAATRTVRVRIRMPDKDRRFHPEMFLTATIAADAGEKLAVPREAVMDTGVRTLVYVVKDGDTFEPREVRIGLRASGYYEVLSGLSEGEEVVVSGNFLVDSESRLRGATGN